MSVKVVIRKTITGYRLYIKSCGGESPAGNRLLRGKPLPNDKWEYEDEEEAKINAIELQLYIDDYENKKQRGIRKNKRLEEEERKYREVIAKHNAINRKT
tara:strand:+ start:813 stop:1112 length:300 start_codon:yes stop_codon:yes gene_type:complete